MSRSFISDSSFSVSLYWLFVGVALTLFMRTFTMPSGQSGRTLWNVPKLSNRFQVLRATGQPPTITPLCVSCVIGLNSQSTAISPLKERGQRYEMDTGFTVKALMHVFTIVRFYFYLHLVHLLQIKNVTFKYRSNKSVADSLVHLLKVQADMQFASPPSRNSAQLKFLLVSLLRREYRPPGLSVNILRKTGRWSWAIPSHINGNHTGTPWMKALLVIKV